MVFFSYIIRIITYQKSNIEVDEHLDKAMSKSDDQSKQKKNLRKVQSFEEKQKQHTIQLYDNLFNKQNDWCVQQLLVGIIFSIC